jgi:hypothetical protein
MRVPGIPILVFRRASCAALAALGAGALFAAPAAAWEELKAPEYSMEVVEGVTTVPEESILYTSAEVRLPHEQQAHLTLRMIHNGLTVAQDTETNGRAMFSQVPQVGDILYLEVPAGNVVGSVVYDGLPSMDPTVCAGATNFSGQRSANEEVEGRFYTLVQHPTYVARRWRGPWAGEAQIASLAGSAFAGSFLVPLALGQTVRAVEHLRTSLAGGATFTYTSENDRPVGACPLPPAPPPPPPLALLGSILKLGLPAIRHLLGSGWTNQVSINQAGTIVEDLYLQGGSVPATAASAKSPRHHRHKPAVLLGRGSAKMTGAGTAHVKIKLTARGRAVLRHARSVRAVLVTTLHSASGAMLNLGRRSVTLHR